MHGSKSDDPVLPVSATVTDFAVNEARSGRLLASSRGEKGNRVFMRSHVDEVSLAQEYTRAMPFEGLGREQRAFIRARGQALYRWFRSHQHVHCLISAGVIALLFAVDFFILMSLPGVLLGAGGDATAGRLLLASLVTATLHGWVLYSLTIYSLHEGAAHDVIFPPRGRVTRMLGRVGNNLCRLSGADPVEYSRSHRDHHVRFGTIEDGEFASFVHPRRFWRVLLPFAMFLNFSDFVAHRGLTYSRSRLTSELLTVGGHGIAGHFMAQRFGVAFPIVTLALLAPHVAFQLDRLRQFSEHNLMPVASKDGARSFGPGFWGLFVGGGPWGQPCHWIHHLIPSIPWYQQIALHREVVAILSPRQREQYLLERGVGYPRLLWRLWTETSAFARSRATTGKREPAREGQP
jgi:fatty acid desaturase